MGQYGSLGDVAPRAARWQILRNVTTSTGARLIRGQIVSGVLGRTVEVPTPHGPYGDGSRGREGDVVRGGRVYRRYLGVYRASDNAYVGSIPSNAARLRLEGVSGLGALGRRETQIDPAVPGIISASGTAAGDIASGIADIFRASQGGGGDSGAAAAADEAAGFIDPSAGGSFFDSTGGKVVVVGGIVLALLATALIVIPRKKAAAVANRRRRNRRRNSPMCGWDVYLRGRKITTVFFVCDMTADEVKRSLVDHDGENPHIIVRRALKANRRRNARRTRLQELQELLPANWVVKTYSPGDGVTRYRFFENPVPEQSYFGPANGRYTALGMKDAMSYASGLRRN